MKEKVHGKGFNAAMIVVIAVCLAFAVVLNVLTLGVYRVSMNNLFTHIEQGEAVDTTQEDWYSVAAEIEAEGVVLLKNENGTLPLTDVTGVNLLGYRSYNHVYSGTGSGATDDVRRHRG